MKTLLISGSAPLPAVRREAIVFVTPDDSGVDGLAPNEFFVWPRDEDRLKMAFMTAA